MSFRAWPQNYQVKAQEGEFLFGGVSGWTAVRALVSESNEHTLSGSSTLKVVCNAAGTVQVYKFGITPFYPGRFMTLRFRKETENVSTTCQVLLSASPANFTNCRYYGANDNGSVVGWNALVFDLDNPSSNLPLGFVYTNQGTGFDRLAGVNSIQFQATNCAVGDTFYIEAVSWGRRARPAVVFGFDSFSNALFADGIPLFTARGIKGYLACSPLGNPAFYGAPQVANLLAAKAAGWDIVNHSYAHSDMTAMTAAQVIADAQANAALLSSHGVLTDPQCFVYPENKCNETVRAALASIGYTYGREVRNWRVLPDIYGIGVPLRTGSFPLASKTLTEAKAALDNAIVCGTMLNMYSHEIVAGGNGSTPPADPLYWYANDMASLLDYAIVRRNQGLVDIPSFSKWRLGLTQPTLVA